VRDEDPRASSDATSLAVVGMAGRFPGAPDLGTYWSNLCSGVESIRFFDDDELIAAGTPRALLEKPEFVRAGAVLDDVAGFDAPFFGYSPREAQLIDPQQRVFLETAWQTLEDAGIDSESFPGVVGVYGGASLSSYLLQLATNPGRLHNLGLREAFVGNSGDFLSSRVAYKMNLGGPACTLQTACSTSLVAVHMACQALMNYEVDAALAGGVSIRVPQISGYVFEESGINSPDGHTRPFDRQARGTVFGSGVGIVVLRRLEDALAEGDRILAVVRGSAVNNDGALKVGFTAPSLTAQAGVVAEALAAGGVSPSSISYVEAHGTGTSLGDPIEVAALTKAFRRGTDEEAFCALGSVKSNIGHLDAAAGISGFIKAVLSLHHRVLPPSLNYEEANPSIPFEGSPFFVNTELRPWKNGSGPLQAGVSSFGFGGTNAHVVLEEAPRAPAVSASRPLQLLTLSAKTSAALETASDNLLRDLEGAPEKELAETAFTLKIGRRAFPYRRSLVCGDREEAITALEPTKRERAVVPGERENPPVVFLFPGQGAQYPGMGRDLYSGEPVFRELLDQSAEILEPELGLDPRGLLFPDEGGDEAAAGQLRQTSLTQPVLFAVEYALARLWMSWGIQPEAMVGHSLGELVAACLAGCLGLEDALKLVAVRGRLMEEQPEGSMLAASLSEEELLSLLEGAKEAMPTVGIAAVNAPGSCVASGPSGEIEELAGLLAEAGQEHRSLHTSHAFHSSMMAPAAETFELSLEKISWKAPQIPWVSNLTGTWITPEEAVDPSYWSRHLLQPVRFQESAALLLTDPQRVFLEVGPGHTLSTLLRRQGGWKKGSLGLTSLPHARRRQDPALATMLKALGSLWQAGVVPDWKSFYEGQQRLRVSLPTYPFEHRDYWIEAQSGLERGEGGPSAFSEASSEFSPRAATSEDLFERPDLSTDFVAPHTSEEQLVAELWRQSLGVGEVGLHDDFFELGGDSLLATRLLSRLRDRCGLALGLDDLFSHPTVEGLASLLDGLEDLSLGLEMSPAPRSGELPLSFAQQRLWFLDQLEPGSAAYNLPGCLALKGPLEPCILEQALGTVTARHESLRTTFPVQLGHPRQVISVQDALSRSVSLPVVDFSALPGNVRQKTSRRILEEESRRSFDLARGPLVRALLLRLEPGEHLFQLTLHHIISDGWSWGVLARELSLLYGSILTGTPSPLADLEFQYADFSHWQRKWLEGEVEESQLAYWKEQLSPEPPVLDLPADRPRPPMQSFRGRSSSFALTPALTRDLRGLGRSQDGTLFVACLTGFFSLLYRLTSQGDLAVGTPIANRRRPELESIVGFFANTLVLRAEVGSAKNFSQLLGEAREVAFQAYAHQDLPFERLVERLQPERDLTRTPFFQVMFELQNAPLEEVEVGGLSSTPMAIETGTAPFDLLVSLIERGEGLAGTLQYNTDLFEETTVQRLGRAFTVLLEGAMRQPDLRISELPILSSRERHQMISEWGRGPVWKPDPGDSGVFLEVFQRVAAENPRAIAATDSGGGSITYAALKRRSRTWARALAELGAGPDRVVPLLAERGIDFLSAMLALFETGAAYLPLDPGHPRERHVRILRQSGATLVLCSAELEEKLSGLATELPSVTVRSLESLLSENVSEGEEERGEDVSGEDQRPRLPGGTPADLAYVIFTSGSTGLPKGAMVEQRGMLNHLRAKILDLDIGAGDVVAQTASQCFDISVWQFLAPLVVGGRVHIVADEIAHDPPRLLDESHRSGMTILETVPSLLAAVLDEMDRRPPLLPRLAELRWLVPTGEALPPALVRRWLGHHPEIPLLNAYGPTECSDDVTHMALHHPLGPEAPRSPIGRPVLNHSLFVTDPNLKPLPVGVPGLLWVSGAGVGRGYLKDPARTAKVFVPDPFGRQLGGRLYRTGDLGRFLATGELDFLGRVDHQIKVRGFRIELGEIEAVLRRQAGVGECVVVAREDRPGDRRLVAYAVTGDLVPDADLVPDEDLLPDAETDSEQERILEGLRQELPVYMVPSALVLLPSLPLTRNGKVDRKALPEPQWREQRSLETEAPSSSAEKILAGIWSEVLGIDDVGIHDNFFRLGGDSILSIQIVTRAAQQGLRLTPQNLFQQQTIGELAQVAALAVPLAQEDQGPVRGEAPLLPSQHWFFAQRFGNPHHWNQPVLLEAEKGLEERLLARAVASLIEHHDALRLRFYSEEGQWKQIHREPKSELEAIPFTLIDLASVPLESRHLVFQERAGELQGSLHLESGPLFHVALFRMGENQADRLLAIAHHLVVDGISWRILLEDLTNAYRQLIRGEDVSLPLKTTSMKGWAERLQELAMEDSTLAEDAAFWAWGQGLSRSIAQCRCPRKRERPGDSLSDPRSDGGIAGGSLDKPSSRSRGSLTGCPGWGLRDSGCRG